MMNFTTDAQISTSHIFVRLKKETIDHLNAYLASQGEKVMPATYDDIIQEWVNWQIKAAEEQKP